MPSNNNINFKINYQKGDTSALDNLKKELIELKSLASNLDMGFSPEEINQLLPAVSALERALNSAFDVRLNTINIQKFNQILAQSGLNAKSLQEGLSVAGAAGDKVFLQMTSQLMKFNTATKQTNKFLNDIANSFFNTVKYSVFNTILNNVMGTVQKATGYVKSLDSSLNDIRIVTGKSADEMSRFAEEANRAAKELAVSTSDYTEGSLIYYQQGLDDETVKTLTDITAMTSNVTGQSMEEVSEQLTAVWNGYRVANQAAEEGMNIYQEYVDKMAAVGAATASDLQELSVAMSKVASAASSMGVDFDDLNAQIATIVSVTRQAPESVGTALKTIYARLGDLKVDGVDEFGVSLGKVSEQMVQMGIQILDQNGDLRDMSSVIAEVAEKWNTWTDAQKQAAAVAMAGKRQYNNLVALFDNWDMYGEALETSMEAAGTLERQQEIALDSLANKMDILRATSEDLYDSLINEDSLKNLIEDFTRLVQLMADFTDATGGLNTLLPALISSLTKLFSQQIAQGLGSVISNIRTDIDKAKVDIQNQAALQAMFKDSSLFQPTTNSVGEQARIEGLTRLKNIYGELSQYQSIMTQEEQQQYNYIVDLANEAGQLNIKIAEQKESWTQVKNSLGLIDKELINDLSNTTKLTNEVNKIKLTAAELEGRDFSWIDFTSFIKQLGLSKEQVSILEKRFTSLSNSGLESNKVIEQIVQELRELGVSTEELVKLDSRARSASEGVQALGSSLEANLNLKATIMSITNTIGALGQLASAINTVSNISNIWSNEDLDTSQKLLQTLMNIGFVLPMVTSAMKTLNTETGIGNILKGAYVSVTARASTVTAAQTAATAKAAIAQEGLNAAIAANPIGAIILAITALISVFILLEKHQEKIRENAKKQAEESKKAADQINKEAEANKTLIDNYNEVLNKYKEGTATKQELYEATDKLLEAYDLEEARLDVLLGKYDDVTEAIKAKRDAELDAQKKINQTAIEDTSESMFLQTEEDKEARGYINRNTDSTGRRTVSYTVAERFDNDQYTEDQYYAIQDKQKEIFGDNLQIDESGNAAFVIDEDDIGATLDFYEKSLEYRRWLRDEGLKDYDVEKRISAILQSLNKDGAIDNLEELRKSQVGIIEEQAHLSDITSKSEFESTINNMKEQLSNLYAPEDIDSMIMSMIGHTNTTLAQQFYIDEAVKTKIGHELDDGMSAIFHSYDPNTQKAIIDLGFDFSEKDALKAFAKIAQSQIGAGYSVSVDFQRQINDTVLKGKDINKADWETYTANLPIDALQKLGEREEFNNKTIGQRITLLEEVNQLIREQNNLAVEAGLEQEEERKKALENLDAQEAVLNNRLKGMQEGLKHAMPEEQRQKIQEQIKEIEQQLIELEKDKYTIEVEIDVNDNVSKQVNSMLGAVLTEGDKIKAATEAIGEGWKVAAEDVGTFASAFPELMEKAELQEDGSLQLDKEYTNQYLENAQIRINENKREAIEAAKTKLKQVELEINYVDKQLELVNAAIDGKKSANDLEQQMKEETTNYLIAMDEAGLISEKDSLLQAQTNLDVASDGMKDSFENINNYIKTVNENFAQMFSENPQWSGLAKAKTGVRDLAYNELDNARKQMLEAQGFNDDDQEALFKQRDQLKAQKEALESLRTDLVSSISLTSASVDAANKAAGRVQQGLAGKEDKSKSSSSKDKDKELKKLDEEFDRYWEIHKALDQIDRDLKRMDKDQENLYGKELIRSLKQENELLANQSQLYEQLYAAQEQEAAELRGTLANSGVIFDASGAVLNYAEATAAALKEYNDAITAYNNGLLDDAALKIHKQKFEQFKKDLERYDTLFYTEMQETMDKIDDLRRQTLANNLKAWEVEIQLKLDFKELEREWNDFIKEVNEDFKSVFKDLRVDMKSMLTDAKTYIGDEGTINTVIGAVHDTTAEIDKMMGGGSSDMYESVSQAQEKLKELNEELLDSATALHDLWEEAWDNYLEGIDQVADAFDDLIERFERINDELEFQEQIIELLYGDEAYALMNKLYEGQERNTAVQLQSLKTQVDMWKDLFYTSGATLDNQTSWTEDQQKYYEQWMEAQSALNDLVIDYIELLKKDYLNTVSSVLQELEKYVTGSSLDDLNTQWERISDNADKYYDSVEGAYYIQTLANKIDQSIADADGLKAQQKLMALREKEIDYLREKETLTEYDIKAAELRYQIALKEIALEDAQNNKTGMKLTRNEQGNWSYQYVADETDVATKQQELLDAYNNLYQLASDAYEANLEALQELQEKYLESAKAIYEDDTLTEEERQAKLLELREWYLEQYRLLSEENQLYRDDLATAGSALLLEIYQQDQEAYEAMTEHERELVDALVNANIDDYMELEDRLKDNYQEIGDKAKDVMTETRLDWTSGAQTIADLWNKDGGWSVKTQVVRAYDAIQEANRKYKEAVDWCAAAVERNFGEEGIVGAIQAAEYETDSLRDKTVEMVNTAIPYLQELRSYVDQIEAAWRSVQQAIMDAIGLIDEYLRKVGEINAANERQAQIAQQQAEAINRAASGSSGGGSGNSSSSSNSSGSISHNYYTAYSDPYGANGTWKVTSSSGKSVIVGNVTTGSSTTETKKNAINKAYELYGQFATGGYTGAWGDSGKLAILHEKELVLNADDTKNFLSAVNTIRTLSSSVGGSIQDAVLKAVVNTALSLGSIKTNGVMGNIANNNSSTDNVFNITAEFPNANSVDDIREAILSLPNLASQYINSTLK